MTDTVLYEKDHRIVRIYLNNPARHNALGEEELLAIQAICSVVEGDSEIRVLVLTSHGDKTFCAGAALNQLSGGQISPDSFQNTTNRLAALRVPTICAINGNVYGGGAELALSCDFRIGIRGTRLRVPAARLGLCYPISGISRYVERLGPAAAKRLLIAAEEFSADELHHIGFLDHLVEPGDLEHRATQLAESIAGLAPLAVQAMKQIIGQAAGGNMDSTLANELASQCMRSSDLQEGFAAQREKRDPQFAGR